MIGSNNGKQINTKPVISLKNFTGMGDNGMYWIDGFLPKSLQGQTILTQGWGTQNILDSTTAGWSNIEDIVSMASYQHVGDNRIAMLGMGGGIFDYSSSGSLGKIHNLSNSAVFFCFGGHINNTRKGNIIYSTANTIGVGWIGKATGGSTTSLIDTNRNFTTLGVTNSADVNKIYNLTKGVEYTLNSGNTTTTNANDTVHFATSTATVSGDWYVAFVDNRFTLGVTTNDNNQQFTPQPAPLQWNRQIVLWNDAYYCLNGNYITSLATDETTWTTDLTGLQTLPSDKFKKQLPNNHQALMMEYNQDRLLVCSYINGRGSLLLWDGYSPNWLSILELDIPVSGVVRYGSGWVVLVGANIYYTDGYTLQYLDKLPDSIFTDSEVPRKYNMVSTEDGFLLTGYGATTTTSRMTPGYYSYNIKDKVLSYFPNQTKNGKLNQVNGALFIVNDYGTTFSQGTPAVYCYNKGFGRIKNLIAKKSSCLLYVKLPQKMNISLIELNLSPRNDYNPTLNQNNMVKVNYGQGENPMFNFLQPGTGGGINLIVNKSQYTYRTKVGQEFFIPYGNSGYERTFVTNITDGGTVDEIDYISPDLSTNPNLDVTYLKKFDLYQTLGSPKTLNSDSFPQEIQFSIPTFYSDKLWLEIVFENQDAFPLDLHSINIF
ncbi:MAG: hypothetical protein WCN88_04860 [Candidatus Falkowbacteria bacterium]